MIKIASLPAIAGALLALGFSAAPPEQAAHGFMTGVGQKDGRQLSGLVKTRELAVLAPPPN